MNGGEKMGRKGVKKRVTKTKKGKKKTTIFKKSKYVAV